LIRDDGLGVSRLGDSANGHRGDCRFGADASREWHLPHGTRRWTRVRVGLAGGRDDQVAAGVAQGQRDLDGIIGHEPAFEPVAAGQARRDRHAVRDGGPHRAKDHQG
jgi:hypothetical protein